MTQVSNKLCAANNFENNKRIQLLKTNFNYSLMLGEFLNDQ